MGWYKTRIEYVEMVEVEPQVLGDDASVGVTAKIGLVMPLRGPQTTMDLAKFHERYEPSREPTKMQRDQALGKPADEKPKRVRKKKPPVTATSPASETDNINHQEAQ